MYKTSQALSRDYNISHTTARKVYDDIRRGIGTRYPHNAIEDTIVVEQRMIRRMLVDENVFREALAERRAHDGRRKPKPKKPAPPVRQGYATKKDLMTAHGISRTTVTRIITSIRDGAGTRYPEDAVIRSGTMTVVNADIFRAALEQRQANDRRKISKTKQTPKATKQTPAKRTKRKDYSRIDELVIAETLRRIKRDMRLTTEDAKAFTDNPASVIDFEDLHEAYDREGQAFDVADYVIDMIEDAYM